MSLSNARAALKHAKRVRRYVASVKRAGLMANDPKALAERVLTGTSQASASTWEGVPQGRGLTYGPGHSPQGSAEARATLRASGPFGTVGWVHDAKSPGGFLYGLRIGVPAAFRLGFGRQNQAIADAMRTAWQESR